jgi:hypothetical protein
MDVHSTFMPDREDLKCIMKVTYKDSPYKGYNTFSAHEFEAFVKSRNLTEEEYLASFLDVLHAIMINDGASEILVMGYSHLLATMRDLCKKYEQEDLALWLNEILLNYEYEKPLFDTLIAKKDREAIWGYWSWFKQHDEDYFKIVPWE